MENKGGMFGDVHDSDLPSELIKANATFQAALANCNFRDQQHLHDACLYVAWLTENELLDEIQNVTNALNGSISIGGYSRVLAASSHVGMIHPSSLGVKLSKEGEKAWAEATVNHKRDRDNDGDNHHED